MNSPKITLLTLRQLIERIGLSKSAIYRRMDPKEKLYDPTFPRPVKMGETTSRWIESEVDDWLEHLICEQRGNAA
ncbi:AlpA family transcriptional regulator [Thiomicrorhabdus sp. 6S3-12]|uniref:helix-turn-helix transcriptional regulator n=1 Tax=Thiomicrorhabdus sp. 6S3-12 TaxID=2819681 RepID=UPI001AACDD3C|nr:AlpA family phage regulatory protein [Thiomicrorhabdus sp. 6S3-12]MBO1923788.1 AlpA family phage regulatory protein [Thiomicrorhabdus sp. 6S3-12]